MNHDLDRDDAFAERVAKPLRAPEPADATFEARVMSAVLAAERAAAPGDSASWWLRPLHVRLTPLASLALAAGVLALAVTGAWLVGGVTQRVDGDQARLASAADRVPARDTVHLVRFVFVDPAARSVSLVGGFNQWRKNTTVLHASGERGLWSVTIPLPPGRHEYAFIVTDAHGERWVADPFTETVHDDYGTESSVVSLSWGS